MKFWPSEANNASTNALGLDIGSRAAKVLLLNRSGQRVDIQVAGSFAIPEGVIGQGIIQEPKELGKLLAQYLEKQNCNVQSVIFSIPSNLAVLRWLNLPELDADELRDAVKFKVKRHLPFPVESAYIEASQELGNKDGQSLVVAVPKPIVESRAEAILYAGLTPLRAELEAQSILRVMERRLSRKGALWRDASLTIIDFGAANTHMYVVQNQRLQFIRGVKFGSHMFHEAVSKSLDIPIEQADAVLMSPSTELFSEGLLSVQHEGTYGIVNLNAELDKLTREFTRLMRYFRSLHPERSYAGILDHAVLCGGLAGLNGLDAYLEENLGIRIEMARPIQGMMTRFNTETFAKVSNQQEAYTVAMGLAMAGLGSFDYRRREVTSGRHFQWARSA